ncbi:MFS transporter [Marinobacter zhejiangensis]|uniref:Drug resistance transporter, EmrB/QacA subfamily n=1 Tax=Marinobacter zhejiangensis TaxID=488535 RepID=A0A1I4PH82_9GAMM|nr:MFS transporter [Marinobacter zhejiangensis]SFM26783.1 drug resistance transporter, EmrB/QacA subfamily [Marinobacter zhejiangensis]
MNNRPLVLLTASLGCALTIFDTNLVGVVMPSLAADLGADFAQTTWLQSSFLLSFASLLMASGALSDRFGRRRIFLIGLYLFGLSALACSAAPSMGVLIAARAVQGVGAAFLLAPALAIIGHTFRNPEESVKAWATWGSLMGLTMVMAPLISSFVGDLLGWRWAFLSVVAISGALLVAVPKVIAESRGEHGGAFDWSGAAVFCLTMLAWTWALISGSQNGWGHLQTVAAATVGCLGIAVYVRVELGKERPMLDLNLFRSSRFVGAVIAMLGYAGTAQVMAALLPLYLQKGMGISFLWTGIALLPFSVAMFLLPSLARRLSGRWDSSWLLGAGLLVIGAGNVWLSFAATSGNFAWSCIGMAILGMGGGLINGETQKAILGSLPLAKQGMGSGISTTARFFGLLVGFTGLSTVMAVGIKSRLQESVCASSPVECLALNEAFQRVFAGQGGEVVAQVPVSAASVYLQGFGDLFLFAGVTAMVAAVLCVGLSARESTSAVRSLGVEDL